MVLGQYKIWWIILGSLAIILLTIFILRTLTPEDTWICDNGQWVRHGNPSSQQPTSQCKK